jgi:hypothetical protein
MTNDSMFQIRQAIYEYYDSPNAAPVMNENIVLMRLLKAMRPEEAQSMAFLIADKDVFELFNRAYQMAAEWNNA